jgi:hypothetical protein
LLSQEPVVFSLTDDVYGGNLASAVAYILPIPSSRRCYPNSAMEWTEYVSPVNNPHEPFFVDTSGDKFGDDTCDGPVLLHDSRERQLHPELMSNILVSEHKPPLDHSRTVAPQLSDEPVFVLSTAQRHVLEMVKQGENVFFTGESRLKRRFPVN